MVGYILYANFENVCFKFIFYLFLVVNLSFADEQTQIKQYETGGIYEGEFLDGKQRKGKYSYLMDITMKVIGKKEKLKVLVKLNTPMDLFMKVHL